MAKKERFDPYDSGDPDTKKKEEERKIDEQLEQTFPASDPPSYSRPGNDLEEEKD